MKIGFDAKRLYCNFTGLGNYSRTLVKNLLNYDASNRYWLYTPKLKERDELNFFKHHPSLQTIVPSGVSGAYWRTFKLSRQLALDGIDVYHGLSHELPVGIAKSGAKSVVTIHDLIFKIYPKTYPVFDRIVYDKKFRYSCEKADKVLAISNSTKQDIIKYYGIEEQKIEVIYQSINPLYLEPSDSVIQEEVKRNHRLPEEFILYVGSVEERKNLKTVVETLRRLPSTFDIPLVVVGKGTTYKKNVEELISTYKLQNRVLWLNRLESNRHLKALYELATVFMYPSIYEGFGLPVAEALLTKTPVITSNVSSLPEAAGPSSYCIHPMDADAAASAVSALLQDKEHYQTIVEKGYTYARETFDAQLVTNQLLTLYDSL